MAINRYSKRTPYQGSLYELPVEFIAKTLENTQKRYDENKEIADTIQDFTMPSMAQDRQRANVLQKQYSDAVDATVAEYSGNYAKASSKLKELTRKIKKDFNPGGEAAAITGNYTNYNTWLKSSQELVDKGKVLGDDFNLANAYELGNYKGIGEFDPVTGSYKMFNPEVLTEYIDSETLIGDAKSKLNIEKSKQGYTVFKNGLKTDYEYETEGLSAKRLKSSFVSALTANPKYTAYMRQKAKHSGMSDKELESYFDEYTSMRAQDLSYMNIFNTSKSDRDQLFLLREKQRLEEEAKKLAVGKPLWDIDGTGSLNKVKATLNALDWRSSIQEKEYSMNPDAISGVPLGLGINVTTSRNDYYTSKYKDSTLQDALKDPEFIAKTGIDNTLMKAIFKSLIAGNQQTYNAKYGTGKDRAWTDAFDKEAAKVYKEQEPSFESAQPYSMKIPSRDARINNLWQIAGMLNNPKNLMVIKFGTTTPISAYDAGLSRASLVDEKNGKLLGENLAIDMPGPAGGAIGFQIQTPQGQFTVVNQEVNINNISNEIAATTRELFIDGRETTSRPVRTRNVNGQDHYAFMHLNTDMQPNGNYAQTLYEVPIRRDERGMPVYVNGQPQPDFSDKQNIHELPLVKWYDNFAPKIQNILGADASKSNNTMFDLLLGR